MPSAMATLGAVLLTLMLMLMLKANFSVEYVMETAPLPISFNRAPAAAACETSTLRALLDGEASPQMRQLAANASNAIATTASRRRGGYRSSWRAA